MESAEIISQPAAFASFTERPVFPTAVGPASMINGSFNLFTYTIRLNFFSSSYLLMEMIVGLPWGQV